MFYIVSDNYISFHIISFGWTSILFKVVNGLKHVLILRRVNILLMDSETFLTYDMTIVHLGVSFSSSFLLVLAAIILSGYPLLNMISLFLQPVTCYIFFQLSSIV